MGAFAKLGNLTSLDLSDNKIVILLDYTFQDLKSLKHLEVGDNDLVYISHKVVFAVVIWMIAWNKPFAIPLISNVWMCGKLLKMKNRKIEFSVIYCGIRPVIG